MKWLLSILFFVVTALPVGAEVPQYNLTGPEQRIVVSWLFEGSGYLDVGNSLGITARQALIADPTLDVTVWIRTSIKGNYGPGHWAEGRPVDQRDWDATGMVWWIWKHNGVNVTPPQRPPESALWVSILQEWAASIDDAFIRVDSVARNASTVPITAEDGTMSTMPAGTQLIHQRSMFTKVIDVLQ